jgi:hypothetical protein
MNLWSHGSSIHMQTVMTPTNPPMVKIPMNPNFKITSSSSKFITGHKVSKAEIGEMRIDKYA